MQRFFEESFYPVTDRSATPPLITEELVKRMMAAAARNGLELVRPAGRSKVTHQAPAELDLASSLKIE